MTTIKSLWFGILVSLIALSVQAHEYGGNGIHVDHPWAMPTPPVKPINSAVYLTVEFDGGEVVELEVYVEQGAGEMMEAHGH